MDLRTSERVEDMERHLYRTLTGSDPDIPRHRAGSPGHWVLRRRVETIAHRRDHCWSGVTASHRSSGPPMSWSTVRGWSCAWGPPPRPWPND